MLLAIDAGNTNIVFAVYDGKEVRAEWRAVTETTRTADEYAVLLQPLIALAGLSFSDIDAAIIATVVPASLFDLRMFCRKYLKSEPMVIGDADVDLGINIQVDRPSAVGADRLVNAIAAHEAYKGPLIVVDFGTATTFDIVGANGDYEGGVIAPGANLSAEALHQAAAMLPRVAVQRTQSVIGKDTVPAMQSGLYWGYLGLIEGLVSKIKEEYGSPMSVVGTGGLANLFYKQTSSIDHLDPDLTIRGLIMIYKRNAKKKELMAASRDDELVFLPLGGSGEIGMNFNAYGYGPPDDRSWIIVDCGVMFGREASTPGIDLIMPDIRYLAEQRENVRAIVLTHAHEDHIGAIAHLWPVLRCPLYATPFTAYLIEDKLKEAGLSETVRVKIVPLGGHLSLGPFEIDFVSITHSIPEPNALSIKTPLGTVVHTGDWKLDPDPLVGDVTDETALNKLGDDGVLALVCDSTNALVPGESGSEAKVRESLSTLIATLKGRVAVTAFASNVARLESVAKAARENNRELVLVGRSMHRIVNAARATGYLEHFPRVLSEEDAENLAPSRVLYLCTGSQGEVRSALARIAAGEHRSVNLGPGDAVVFSSRIIPGNELPIFEMQNQLAALGVEVLTEQDHFVHVSGHPCREELSQMYRWVRPQIAVPVHGERRQQEEHARLAKSLQVPQAIVPENGQLFRLAPGRAKLIDETPSGRVHLDGTVLVAEGEGYAKARRAMGFAGLIVVTLVLDQKGRIATEPMILFEGIPEPIHARAREALDGVVKRHNPKRDDEEKLKETARRAVRRAASDAWGKKPVTRVEVLWV